MLLFLFLKHVLGQRKVLYFVSFCSTVLHCKIAGKNEDDYFANFIYRGLFLELIPCDKQGFTVHSSTWELLDVSVSALAWFLSFVLIPD